MLASFARRVELTPTAQEDSTVGLRKIALDLVAKDRGSRASLRGRRKKAAWNDDYMLQLIVGRAHA